VAQTVHDVSVLFGIDHGEKGGNLGDAEEHLLRERTAEEASTGNLRSRGMREDLEEDAK